MAFWKKSQGCCILHVNLHEKSSHYKKGHRINSLSILNDKIVDMPKLKAFAGNKIDVI